MGQIQPKRLSGIFYDGAMASLVDVRCWFTEHPSSVDESYREHFMVALGFSRRLAAASGAALLHAVCPSLCTTTASDRVKEMCDEMMSRHATADCDEADDLAVDDRATIDAAFAAMAEAELQVSSSAR